MMLKYSRCPFAISHLTTTLTKWQIRFPCSILHKNIHYDVVVVGGGHAGTEACAAAARMGARTLLVTHKKSMIGAMSCNPSFGGIGKGHLMKEVDALDGICGRICDISGVHYKILNKKKGPACWGYRAQIDRSLYKKYVQKELFSIKLLDIIESSVEDILVEESANEDKKRKCSGVLLSDGREVECDCVVLTTGTFLRGSINIGLDVRPAGRMGDEPAIGLARTLERLNFNLGRLKTGTPPRLAKNTIDFSVCQPHYPDNPSRPFSFMNDEVWIKPEDQVNCYMTHTNEKIVKIVRDTLHLNRHVKEEVKGPRYCPSLEARVLRFPHLKNQLWLEPEGLDSPVIYPQGLSCTMPAEYQQKIVQLINGLENAEIVQPGYGVEYDYVNPQELSPLLETKKIMCLFFAGQINGTTGYEEAAAQGIVAGINAAAKSKCRPGISIDRTEGYIGVLIDDLTTHGTSEPYRMFTSRAEFRLKLRPDNADIRLTRKGFEVGCVSEERYKKLEDTTTKLTYWKNKMESDCRKANTWAELIPDYVPSRINPTRSAFALLGNLLPELDYLDSFKNITEYSSLANNDREILHRLKIEALYKDPIQKEDALIHDVRMNQALTIPDSIDYFDKQMSLSIEMREKLMKIRPATVAALISIPGITPATIVSVLAYVKVQKKVYSEVS